jgi:hypothetical protein
MDRVNKLVQFYQIDLIQSSVFPEASSSKKANFFAIASHFFTKRFEKYAVLYFSNRFPSFNQGGFQQFLMRQAFMSKKARSNKFEHAQK